MLPDVKRKPAALVPWRIPRPALEELRAAAEKLRQYVGRPLAVTIDDEELACTIREQAVWAGQTVDAFITDKLRDIVRSLDPNGP